MSLTHDYDAALKYAYRRLERSPLAEGDKRLIRGFAEHMAARGVSKIRLATVVEKSVLCAERLGVPAASAGRGEVERLMRWLLQESGVQPGDRGDGDLGVQALHEVCAPREHGPRDPVSPRGCVGDACDGRQGQQEEGC